MEFHVQVYKLTSSKSHESSKHKNKIKKYF